MNDPVREELMDMTRRLSWCFYVLGDMRFPLTGYRAIAVSSKYGVCGASAIGFAQAGLILIAVQQDYQGARKFADHAFKILSVTHSDKFRSSVGMLVYAFIFFWTRPIAELLPSVFDSYKVGLRFG